MIVLVEGMDRTGKSTFCRKLVRAWGGCLLHVHNGPPVKGEDVLERYRQQCMLGEQVDLVLDRGWWSEVVCSEIHRWEKIWSPSRFNTYEGSLPGTVKVVLLEAPLSVLEDRDDGESLWSGDRTLMRAEKRRFRTLATWSALDVTVLKGSWTDEEVEQIARDYKEKQ